MKTFLSRRGYALEKSRFSEEELDAVRKELTVKPTGLQDFGPIPEFSVFLESNKKLYIPRNYGLQKFGAPSQDKLAEGAECPRLRPFAAAMRPEQVGIIDGFLEAAADPARMGGLLELPTGFGKTVCALKIMSELGRKTLIICHKQFLLNQWKERIEQYIPTAKMGMIKQNRVVVKDCDIILASLQSLALRDYGEETFADIGVVVVDECHHIAAEVFSRCLPRVTSRVMLGLSATMTRTDGLTKVIHWFMGDSVAKIRRRADVTNVQVQCVRYYSSDPAYSTEHQLWNRKPNITKMMTDALAYGPRNAVLLSKMMEIKRREPDRVFLVLSHRRGHLTHLKAAVDSWGLGSCGFYVGGMSQADLDESAKRDFIFATMAMAAEGLDIPRLNTLVLGSSSGNVNQAVGRILRGHGSQKVSPLVLDFIDNFSVFSGQARKRSVFYKSCNFEILSGDRQDQEEDKEEEVAKNPENVLFAFVNDDE